jgi:competence transcription factor ComK
MCLRAQADSRPFEIRDAFKDGYTASYNQRKNGSVPLLHISLRPPMLYSPNLNLQPDASIPKRPF